MTAEAVEATQGLEQVLPEYDWDEIRRHDLPGDFWVVFRGGVYDVSEWMYRHPGGAEILIEAWGHDATELFESIGHSEDAIAMTGGFRVGTVAPDAVEPEEVGVPTMSTPAGQLQYGPGPFQAGPKLNPLPEPEGGFEDPRAFPEYTWEEVIAHDKPGDYWVVVYGAVYDVSEWIYHHPGGAEVLIDAYGHDATEAFDKAAHSDEAWTLTGSFKIGVLAKDSVPPRRPGRPRISNGHHRHAHAPVAEKEELAEIPWGVRWLVPKGERFVNYDVVNDNDSQLDYAKRHGPIYAVGIPTKKWRLVMVSDPDLLDEVADHVDQFGKRVEDINFFDQLAAPRADGISEIGDGEHYDQVRRVMLPWYAPANQKTQFARMKAVAARMLAAWEGIPEDTPLDMRDWMTRYALEISGRGACNYDFGTMDAGNELPPLATAVIGSTRESISRIAEPRPDFTMLSGMEKRRRKRLFRRHNALLYESTEMLVRGRVGTCPVGEQSDLLTRLITTPDVETGSLLDLRTVRDQILMHFSNGFNGPATIGAWLPYVISQHADVEERLIAEVDSITGGNPAYDLQYTDLMAMPYATQVIKETLRIYPPMPVTIRRSLKDGRLGRYRIRKDDIILVGSLAVHRDPRYWGDHPEEFDPDHFSMERVVERPRHAFIPFSVGVRQCMAQEVTFMMLRIALFSIYNRYRLSLAPGELVVKNTVATTKPGPVRMLRTAREGREEREAAVAARRQQARERGEASVDRSWDRPSEIPETSPFGHLVIAYGSNFGTCKDLAERFAERSRVFGFTYEVLTLDELAKIPPRTQPWLLVVVTATYTSNPPGNAIAFKAYAESTAPGLETWRHCRYLVYGLGNSQWNAFLAFPRYVHAKLEELGAIPLVGFAFGDVGASNWEESYTAWNDRSWPILIELAGAAPSEAAASREAERAALANLAAEAESAVAVSLEGEFVGPTVLTNAVGITTTAVRVAAVRELHDEASQTKTRHVELEMPDGFSYRAGDHLGVCPQNSPEVVRRLAERLGVKPEGVFAVPKAMRGRVVPRGVPLQVGNVLGCLVDISAMPSVAFVELLLHNCVEPSERRLLEDIRDVLGSPQGPDNPLCAALNAGGYDTVSLLEQVPSCEVSIFELLEVAQPLKPRYYSTSSCPRVHDVTVHLSVGRQPVTVPRVSGVPGVPGVPGLPGREFAGMCASYVHTLRAGDVVNVFLDRAEGFHLQDDLSRPMVFVSAGTGFAPMRAFLFERLAYRREGVDLGPALLFNGIRSRKLDFIYGEEIENFVAEGVLDALHLATSREDPNRRVYVQDLLVEQGAWLWQLLEDGAFVYVCGSQRMRDDVRAAFVQIVREFGGAAGEAAEQYLSAMELEHRYRPDVWG